VQTGAAICLQGIKQNCPSEDALNTVTAKAVVLIFIENKQIHFSQRLAEKAVCG
jgi:hypothetical protein